MGTRVSTCFIGFIKSVHVVEFTISVACFIIQILNGVGGLHLDKNTTFNRLMFFMGMNPKVYIGLEAHDGSGKSSTAMRIAEMFGGRVFLLQKR